MANNNLRFCGVWYGLGVVCMMMMAEKGGAYEFKVGGSGVWAVPADSALYNQWAGKMRFQIGDTLAFNYQGDSVLEVTSEAYTNCTTDSPISSSSDGHTVIKFTRSGPHYFISGTKDRCLKNEKLAVVVMADRSGRTTNQPPPSDMIPSPAPSADSSPPAGTVETNPTPAPSTEDDNPPPAPKKNAASPAAASLVGSAGVFMAYVIALSL